MGVSGKTAAQFADSAHAFGYDKGRADFKPIHTGANGEGSGFNGFVEIYQIKRDLDYRRMTHSEQHTMDNTKYMSRSFLILIVTVTGVLGAQLSPIQKPESAAGWFANCSAIRACEAVYGSRGAWGDFRAAKREI